MAKATIPQRLVRDIERTLQGRINEVRRKLAKHYEQSRAALHEIAVSFGIDEAELFTLAEVPAPPGKPKRRRQKKKASKKSTVKKRTGGGAGESVAAVLKSNPAASGAEISKATGYASKTVYKTKAWKDRPQPQRVVKKKASKKSTVKKRTSGTAGEHVATVLKRNPAASGVEISKATGYSIMTVYKTKAWKDRLQPTGGTAEEHVAAVLKRNPAASGVEISKATGHTNKTVYKTKAWKDRPQPQ